MASIPVVVKHNAKTYNLEVEPSSNGETFKFQVYSITGVEPERQKVMLKGKLIKDDTEMDKLNIKAGTQIMVMGSPAGGVSAIQKPKEEMKFIEDMTEAEAAQSEGALPAGLQNLGNTCYMNSTLQTLRAIPELQQELQQYHTDPSNISSNSLGDLSQFGLGGLGASSDLTASLRDLYKQMTETQEGFPPLMFLNAFRTAFPQFAERSRDGKGYAQQDAEEAWSQIVTTLKQKLKINASIANGDQNASGKAAALGFVDQYMGGKFQKVEKCIDEAAIEAGEQPTQKAEETFYKLNCHVASKDILHLREGIAAALTDTYTKSSPTLNRNAEYVTKSQISRLPKYLPVHFVRFYWKRDVNKKAKILRKVTFPHELDVVEYCSDELKSMLIPVRDKIRDLRKEELDVERARKRQKRMANRDEVTTDLSKEKRGAESSNAGKTPVANASAGKQKDGNGKNGESADAAEEEYKTDAQIEAERAASILALKKELLAAVNPTLAADSAANQTGLYELRGVITHQGASADSGHYTAYVKKEPRMKTNPATGKKELENDDKWWWFNDDKVSEVDAEKIETLAGGGESHSALILLYRAVDLPQLPEDESMAAA